MAEETEVQRGKAHGRSGTGFTACESYCDVLPRPHFQDRGPWVLPWECRMVTSNGWWLRGPSRPKAKCPPLGVTCIQWPDCWTSGHRVLAPLPQIPAPEPHPLRDLLNHGSNGITVQPLPPPNSHSLPGFILESRALLSKLPAHRSHCLGLCFQWIWSKTAEAWSGARKPMLKWAWEHIHC